MSGGTSKTPSSGSELERIDLYQLHGWFPDGITTLDWLEVLNALRQEGKIDRIGVSIRDYRPEDGVDLARFGLVDSLQVVFNMFEHRPPATSSSRQPPRATACIAPGAVRLRLAHRELDRGHLLHLAGRLRTGMALPRGALRRDSSPRHRAQENSARRISRPSPRRPCGSALSSPAVSTVIPGMLTPAEVDMNVAYSDGIPFPPELLASLAGHGWPRNFYQ